MWEKYTPFFGGGGDPRAFMWEKGDARVLCMAPKRQSPQKRRKGRRSLFTHTPEWWLAQKEEEEGGGGERPGPNLISRLSDGQKETEERGRAGKQGPEKDVGSALLSSSSERIFLNLRCFPFF